MSGLTELVATWRPRSLNDGRFLHGTAHDTLRKCSDELEAALAAPPAAPVATCDARETTPDDGLLNAECGYFPQRCGNALPCDEHPAPDATVRWFVFTPDGAASIGGEDEVDAWRGAMHYFEGSRETLEAEGYTCRRCRVIGEASHG